MLMTLCILGGTRGDKEAEPGNAIEVTAKHEFTVNTLHNNIKTEILVFIRILLY
jgi:hypothetical protein